jgi:putative hemin transport protein
MNHVISKTPTEIRTLRQLQPKLRARDFAAMHTISEADLVAAEVGRSAIRLRVDVEALLTGLPSVGEVMALTRNESAVHEKMGPYVKPGFGPFAAIVLGEDIDLRIFPKHWAHGYAVAANGEDGETRHSLQFFDVHGDAVHKVHARPATNLTAWNALVETLRHPEQLDELEVTPRVPESFAGDPASAEQLRSEWRALTDTHQFFPMLRRLNLPRHQALKMVGEEFAWQIDAYSVKTMFDQAAETQLPIMAFVGNHGCIQIHGDTVNNIVATGPWLNVLDEKFHLHLRADHFATVWAVRKPTKDGHATSVEVFDAKGELIIQFFGLRLEGTDERPAWRSLVHNLPSLKTPTAA